MINADEDQREGLHQRADIPSKERSDFILSLSVVIRVNGRNEVKRWYESEKDILSHSF